MADIICRWRNGTPKTVVELVNSLPHKTMPNEEFRLFMQNSVWGSEFFHTPYQLACQLGLYCEAEDGLYYPRFDHDINEDEAKEYLEFWMPRYYVPNPYVGRNGFNDIKCPTYVLYELYKYATHHANCTYKEAYKAAFHEEPTNNNDIVKNYINNYSKVLYFDSNGYLTITKENPLITFSFMDRSNKKDFFDNFSKNNEYNNTIAPLQHFFYGLQSAYRLFITAIKSKPFLLLAGISGTGKSRIVRELARACWDANSEEYKAQKPKNFEMVQVKPNWHDSSELIGYVSRVSGQPVFVAGDFLKFVARAWEDSNVPYFLCLDEMNLAPVEQYFAEYLSVVESRKADLEGNITTDPILKKSKEDWYRVLTSELTNNDDVRNRFLEDGICIPQNLIIVGTVNMDETTFSFSRKVLDRAMTIEMNKVDLNGGLTTKYEQIGKLGYEELIGKAVEGVDVYASYKNVCDTAIAYLLKINEKLDGTPFKVAYRTRNEVLLYVINNLPYNKIEGDDESTYLESFVVARALDEITNMKILSRIEGDESKVSEKFLNELSDTIKKGLEDVFEGLFDEDDDEVYKSVSLAKIEEMKGRLESGYTSFWS